MSDQLIRAISKDGCVKATAVSTRDLTERARQIHRTLPVATAALGRTLMAASMMGNQLKEDNGSVTLRIKGDGPLGGITAVADSAGNARGYVVNPAVDLPLKGPAKLDVGSAVGRDGSLTVIKDLNLKEPYVGTVPLVSGEIAEEYRGRDVVTEVEGELQAWAERNTLEIARLRENEQYRKEFVGNVSHELKTPLCSIQGYILTLLDGGLEDPDINRKYLEQTEKNIERLIHIVRDLEDISRLEAGTLELRRERFDLLALVDEIMQSLEMQAAERGIVLVSDAGPLDRLMVDADRARVGQVLINLLSNSIKYGKEGGRTRVRYVDMFEKVMVEVQDNGIGLTAEQLPRIFERFYRVDKSRSRAAGGTGLGLAIVKHILEAHKETITVRSTPDVGTTFSFTLAKA